MEFMYLVFTRMPGESYIRRLRSLLLYLCYVFRALINSLVCWFCTSALSLVLFQFCSLQERTEMHNVTGEYQAGFKKAILQLIIFLLC